MDKAELLKKLDERIEIPAASYIYYVSHDVIEQGCQMDHGPRQVEVGPLAVNKYPITNIQYKRFLEQSGYEPRDKHNFLVGWVDGCYPDGTDKLPVTWVSQEDARAYAQWVGGRLPTDEQWQYIASGDQKLLYPWGDWLEDERCNGLSGKLSEVDAYENGASPFGVMDMCGNCHEWTDTVYDDGMCRFALLRGGSCLTTRNAMWHMTGGTQPNTHHQKIYLLNEGQNRSELIGFRCVWDREDAR